MYKIYLCAPPEKEACYRQQAEKKLTACRAEGLLIEAELTRRIEEADQIWQMPGGRTEESGRAVELGKPVIQMDEQFVWTELKDAVMDSRLSLGEKGGGGGR